MKEVLRTKQDKLSIQTVRPGKKTVITQQQGSVVHTKPSVIMTWDYPVNHLTDAMTHNNYNFIVLCCFTVSLDTAYNLKACTSCLGGGPLIKHS